MTQLGLRPKLPLPEHRCEQERADWACEQLAPWFHIQREVWGRHCSGRKVRVDAVFRPVDPTGWLDVAPAFAVEFKLPQLGDTRNFTSWMAQMVDYTHVDWVGYGRLAVFACPSAIADLTLAPDTAVFTSRLLCQMKVGELAQMPYRGWALLLGEHVMWSVQDGPRDARRWRLRPKVGSR